MSTVQPTRKQFGLNKSAAPSCRKNKEMVTRFRAWLIAQNYLASTVAKYCNLCEGFCVFIGTKPMAEVVPLDISDFVTADLPTKHWGDGLVNGRLAALRETLIKCCLSTASGDRVEPV